MATATFTKRETAALKSQIANQLAYDDAALAEQALLAERGLAAVHSEEKRLEDLRRSAHVYLNGAQTFEEGLRLMCAGLETMKGEVSGLVKPLGASMAYSWRGVLDRAGRRLSNALAGTCETGDWMGRLKLGAGHRARTDEDFALEERRMLEPRLQPQTNGVNGVMK